MKSVDFRNLVENYDGIANEMEEYKNMQEEWCFGLL